jgi:hypothetical protein
VDSKMERAQIIDGNPALTYMWGKYRENAAFSKYLELEVTYGNQCDDKTHSFY